MSSAFYIKGFNGLRAVSILLVVLNHAGWFENPDNTFFRERLWRMISGEAGVNLFFAISGFLITFLLLREKEDRGYIRFGYFFIRRFLRLMPPLFIFLSVVTILGLTKIIDIHPLSVVASALYLYNYLPQKWNMVELTHTWSLGVEEQFYLTWPFVIHFFRGKKYLIVCIILIVLSLILIVIFPLMRWEGINKTYHLTEAFRPLRWILPAALPVLAGAMTAYLSFNGRWNYNKQIRLLGGLLYTSVLFLPITFLSFYLFFQALAFGILVAEIYRFQNSRITAFLEWRPIAFTGIISYSIYIWQGLFLRTGPGSGLWFQQFPANIVLSVSAAVLSYYLLEKPFNKYRMRYK